MKFQKKAGRKWFTEMRKVFKVKRHELPQYYIGKAGNTVIVFNTPRKLYQSWKSHCLRKGLVMGDMDQGDRD